MTTVRPARHLIRADDSATVTLGKNAALTVKRNAALTVTLSGSGGRTYTAEPAIGRT